MPYAADGALQRRSDHGAAARPTRGVRDGAHAVVGRRAGSIARWTDAQGRQSESAERLTRSALLTSRWLLWLRLLRTPCPQMASRPH